MKPRQWIAIGALWAGLAVALGAFGAHGLQDRLIASETLGVWETAVRYQIWHALAIILCGLILGRHAVGQTAAWIFLVGNLLFSGSLYGLALGVTSLGPATPLGGALMLLGWAWLTVRALRAREG